MKTGKTLVELAQELERQNEAKKDYVADSSAVTMAEDAKTVEIDGVGHFGITQHAENQLAARLDIPVSYYKRLKADHPDLLAKNVNELNKREPQRGMIRTLDGKIRALPSDRYRPLDNFDLGNAIIPVLIEAGAKVASCELTETKLYIKALCPWLDRQVEVPEGLKMGEGHNWFVRSVTGAITISNSEVGAGMIAVSPGVFERMCTNLAVMKDQGFGKTHVGKKIGGDDPVAEYLSGQTKAIEDAAVWSRVRDIAKATMDGRMLDAAIAKMNEARGRKITGDVPKVVEVFAKKHGLNEPEKGGLLKYLYESGEATQYGLQWGVTRLANDQADYDRASDLERLGGAVIEMAPADWEVLARAA